MREDASVRSGAGVRGGSRARPLACGRDGRPDSGRTSRDNGRKRGRRIMRTWGRAALVWGEEDGDQK